MFTGRPNESVANGAVRASRAPATLDRAEARIRLENLPRDRRRGADAVTPVTGTESRSRSRVGSGLAGLRANRAPVSRCRLSVQVKTKRAGTASTAPPRHRRH